MRDLFLGLVLGFLCALFIAPRLIDHEPTEIVRRDTILVRDTVVVEQPKIITERIIDSIPYIIAHTDTLRDTLYVARSQKIYSEEDYKAWVSGYEPSLDSIYIFPQKEIVTITPKKKRWGIGLQAGYGYAFGGWSPYVGIGITYNLFQW